MIYEIYHNEIPLYVLEIMNTDIFKRLKDVGMNCGMEYTKFKTFENSKGVSRYNHSIGVALITYHFTHDIHATVAALLHDISTPVFAHVIDFLNHDYEKQESTEAKTKEMIENSEELKNIFEHYDIDIHQIYDYHQYPIADNDSPKLSADRLEYTLSNAYYYQILSLDKIKTIYNQLTINDEQDEIIVKDEENALLLTEAMFKCSDIYTSDEDRYCMEYLARLLKEAIEIGVLTEEDLYSTETYVIDKMCQNETIKTKWNQYCQFNQIDISDTEKDGYLKVNAKHRYFNPLVGNIRIIDNNMKLKHKLETYLNDHFDRYIKAY